MYVSIDASGKHFRSETLLDREMAEIAKKYRFEIFEYSIYDDAGKLIKAKSILRGD